jgi:hypothetical protein
VPDLRGAAGGVLGGAAAPPAGGLLFAVTYHRTASAFAAAVEHALYGCFLITLGLGRFVYSGN